MAYCKACSRHCTTNRTEDGLLFVSCDHCGKVLKFDNFSNDVTFVKNAAGQSKLAGTIVKSVEAENQSRQRLYAKAYEDISSLKNGLGMGENMAMVNQALKYYRIAVERNFTKGRRTEHVQAVCLYVACRENRKPYLLIDFSIYLRINVFVLGAVFLQLCRVLSLTEHHIYQKLLDPSVFIHKYTNSLTGGKNKDVSNTALSIIATMNRDWMQTGRMPGGVWGSALYIAALAHGISCSKEDILRLVHVCEATLTKRLVEFESTESASLTIEELNARVEELKRNAISKGNTMLDQSFSGDLLCSHKGTGMPSFALRLCKECYANSIGFEGGADPPAFQRSERQRLKTSLAKQGDKQEANDGAKPRQQDEASCDNAYGSGEAENDDEIEMLADIDEAEVDGYVIKDKKEIELKTALWEELNREFLMEQELKKAAAKDGIPTEKTRAKRRSSDAKNSEPAQSAAESCYRMIVRKRLSSKVNYEALEKLFADPDTIETKKAKAEDEEKKETKLGGDVKHVYEAEDGEQDDYKFDEQADDEFEITWDGYDDDF